MAHNILLLFHVATNTGYAIAPLEQVFDAAARTVAGATGRVHYAYQSMAGGRPQHLHGRSSDITTVSDVELSAREAAEFSRWVAEREIDLVLGFDLSLRAPVLSAIRAAGRAKVIAYWGASISGVYPWYLRPLRRLQYLASPHRPDHYVFESEGMRDGALYGAMIPRVRTSLCRLGVDTDVFRPDATEANYAHSLWGIPSDREIVFFSGHMEPRKGVDVLIRAFVQLLTTSGRRDLQLLLLGNKDGDAEQFTHLYSGTEVASHVTFGGYRNDLHRIHRDVAIGAIASTGWDSFTMSAVELAASAVPLVVSDLPGLREAVVPNITGLTVPPGDVDALASAIGHLADDHALRQQLGTAARERVLREFSRRRQIMQIAETMRRSLSGASV
jgi:glycosyltransferase involved in cell wall biosynthesis